MRMQTSAGAAEEIDLSVPPAELPKGTGTSLPSREALSEVGYAYLLLTAFVLGALLRVVPALVSNFPLADGGMFYTMTRELEANHFVLPQYTNYNHAHIPFDYPPLGLYVVAGVHAIVGVPWLEIFLWLPAVITSLTLGAFFLLVRELHGSRIARAGSMLAFALASDSLDWEIKGGGVTRSFGLLFALLTLWALVKAYRTGGKRWFALMSGLLALTVLSHLEWSWFAACGILVLLMHTGRNSKNIAGTAAACAGAGLLAAPWWVLILTRHGVGPIVATFGGSEQYFPWYARLADLLTLGLVAAPFAYVVVGLAVVGAVVCVARGSWLLPSWLGVTVLLTSRGPQQKVVVVLALLVGVAVAELTVLLIGDRLGSVPVAVRTIRSAGRTPRLPLLIAAGFFVLQPILSTIVDLSGGDVPLAIPDRTAMSWVRKHTPTSARFLLLTGNVWSFDNTSEWFPALTDRINVSTVQGTEWLPGGFARVESQDSTFQKCAVVGLACLESALRGAGEPIDYVYIDDNALKPASDPPSPECCSVISTLVSASPHYLRVYRMGGVAIYRRLS